MVSGSEFHKVGPETAKLLCPYLIVLLQDRHALQIRDDFVVQMRDTLSAHLSQVSTQLISVSVDTRLECQLRLITLLLVCGMITHDDGLESHTSTFLS